MKKHQTIWIIRVLPLLAFLAPLATAPAYAQSDRWYDRWEGEFKLPFQVSWGNQVLPPGEYKFSVVDSAFPKTSLITFFGKEKTVSLYSFRASRCHHKHSALMIAQPDGRRNIYSLHVGNQVYYYGTRQVEDRLIAAGVTPAGCCHTVCCRTVEQHTTHARLVESIPVKSGGK